MAVAFCTICHGLESISGVQAVVVCLQALTTKLNGQTKSCPTLLIKLKCKLYVDPVKCDLSTQN